MGKESILGIYSHRQNIEGLGQGFFFLHLFDGRGQIDRETLIKIYRDLNQNDEILRYRDTGPFESMESLNRYAFQLCEEMNAPSIGLVSDHVYNQLIEQAASAGEFRELLYNSANKLENPDGQDSKGIFGKIFN